eukprot:gene5971-biopygen42076
MLVRAACSVRARVRACVVGNPSSNPGHIEVRRLGWPIPAFAPASNLMLVRAASSVRACVRAWSIPPPGLVFHQGLPSRGVSAAPPNLPATPARPPRAMAGRSGAAVWCFLDAVRLQQYADVLAALGVDTVEQLCEDVEDSDLADVGVKKVHIKTIRRHLSSEAYSRRAMPSPRAPWWHPAAAASPPPSPQGGGGGGATAVE